MISLSRCGRRLVTQWTSRLAIGTAAFLSVHLTVYAADASSFMPTEKPSDAVIKESASLPVLPQPLHYQNAKRTAAPVSTTTTEQPAEANTGTVAKTDNTVKQSAEVKVKPLPEAPTKPNSLHYTASNRIVVAKAESLTKPADQSEDSITIPVEKAAETVAVKTKAVPIDQPAAIKKDAQVAVLPLPDKQPIVTVVPADMKVVTVVADASPNATQDSNVKSVNTQTVSNQPSVKQSAEELTAPVVKALKATDQPEITPNKTADVAATQEAKVKPVVVAQTTTVSTPANQPAETITIPIEKPAKNVPDLITVDMNRPDENNKFSHAAAPALPIKQSSDRISFYFQNVSIKTLLQLIAKNSGMNFIISEDVKGSTTLNLKNVTWRQALTIILQSHGLASKQIGSALFISTSEDIAQKQAKEFQAVQDATNMAPLSTSLITLKYSDAATIAKVLKSSESSLLTGRGEVSVNVPTNSIIIRDVQSNLNEVKKYVSRLDIPARQVSIEARIVNIDATYESQLGVRFGVSNTRSLSGTLAGANQLRNGTNVAAVRPLSQRLNFNIPANVLSNGTTPGSIGLALARLGPVLLDLELSALEEEGHTQIISKPRVVTANQQKATIQAGEEIPYQQATSSGATSVEFKKAVLSLEIVPQITPDDRIILKLKANQDTRGPQLLVAQGSDTTGSTTSGSGTSATTTSTPAVFGPPTINTQSVESLVLLNDNETVVIGGIYKLTKSNTFDRVPFFGSLPLVGGLFRHRGIKNEKSELLIFLTPKIIKQRPRNYVARNSSTYAANYEK